MCDDDARRELRRASQDGRREDPSSGGGAGAGGGKAKAVSLLAPVRGGLRRSNTMRAREMEALSSMRMAEQDVRQRLVAVKRELQRSMSANAVAVAKDNLTLSGVPHCPCPLPYP